MAIPMVLYHAGGMRRVFERKIEWLCYYNTVSFKNDDEDDDSSGYSFYCNSTIP